MGIYFTAYFLKVPASAFCKSCFPHLPVTKITNHWYSLYLLAFSAITVL